jgi:hypothetical protein
MRPSDIDTNECGDVKSEPRWRTANEPSGALAKAEVAEAAPSAPPSASR